MVKIALAGVCSVLLALNLKGYKSEYSTYIALASCLLIGGYVISLMEDVIEVISRISSYLNSGKEYIVILIKIAGITYISDFASSICQDAGHASIASSIDFGARVTILTMSIPLLICLMDVVDGFAI